MFRMLSVPFVRDKYIINSGDLCNYEIYISELLNKSEEFKKCYGRNFEYIPKEKQNNGEADVHNSNYELDFKLFIASTVMYGLNSYSESIIKYHDAIVGRGPSKKKGNIKASNIISIFKNNNLESLKNYEKNLKKCHCEENDVYQILKILRTDKNTLFFLPYYFIIENNEREDIDEFSNKLKEYFALAWKYRREYVNKDTFFVTIYGRSFVIYSIKNGEWIMIDKVRVVDLCSFVKLFEFCKEERKYFFCNDEE